MISKRVYVAWCGIHFFFITAVCFAGLFSLVAERATILPPTFDTYARKSELLAAGLLGKHAASKRRAVAQYFGASEATIASKRGSPRSGSHSG